MANMSKFIDMLEAIPDLEGSIIRETRINKVMKQIMKLDSIPKESEFKFKSRSQELLNKWNKVMASDGATNGANGVNGAKSPTEEKKSGTPAEKVEVVAVSDDKPAEKPEDKTDATEGKPETKVESAEPAKSAEPETKAEEPAKEVNIPNLSFVP